jgi:hypothetical protein
MKKLIFSLLSGAIILGGTATYAFAHSNESGNDIINFGQMKPYIEEMHPDLSTQEQKALFDSCHGAGAEINGNNTQDMMNNL